MALATVSNELIDSVFEVVKQQVTSAKRYPVSTYRLQFNRSFTFRDATRLLPYLCELGITDIYASPYLKARPGSLHGYDITDHNSLNPEIGSPEQYNRFVSQLQRRGMGQVLELAFAALVADGTLQGVVDEHQLHQLQADSVQLGRGSDHLLALGYVSGTGRQGPGRPGFYLHHADAAGADGVKGMVVAERRDINAVLPGRVQDGGALFRL